MHRERIEAAASRQERPAPPTARDPGTSDLRTRDLATSSTPRSQRIRAASSVSNGIPAGLPDQTSAIESSASRERDTSPPPNVPPRRNPQIRKGSPISDSSRSRRRGRRPDRNAGDALSACGVSPKLSSGQSRVIVARTTLPVGLTSHWKPETLHYAPDVVQAGRSALAGDPSAPESRLHPSARPTLRADRIPSVCAIVHPSIRQYRSVGFMLTRRDGLTRSVAHVCGGRTSRERSWSALKLDRMRVLLRIERS